MPVLNEDDFDIEDSNLDVFIGKKNELLERYGLSQLEIGVRERSSNFAGIRRTDRSNHSLQKIKIANSLSVDR